MITIESTCNSCSYEGVDFVLRFGSETHFDGELIDADAPRSEWFECPRCNFLNS